MNKPHDKTESDHMKSFFTTHHTHTPSRALQILVMAMTLICFALYSISNTLAETAAPSKASASYSVHAEYAVFASGFRTLKAHATIREEQDRYATYVTIETDGLLKTLAPWQGILSSIGMFAPTTQKRQPQLHAFDNIWRGTNKRIEQHYDQSGTLDMVTIKEDGRPDETKAPEAALADGATDILSAALEASKIIKQREQESGKSADSCASQHAVYDGKRRFILAFKDVETDIFEASKYSAYTGRALKCVVEITPDGGKWRDKPRGWMSIQEQSKDRGQPPYIWFGKLTDPKNSDISAYAPVKLQVKTSYGTLMLHMKNASIKAIETTDTSE